jgi:hypothetical protein
MTILKMRGMKQLRMFLNSDTHMEKRQEVLNSDSCVKPLDIATLNGNMPLRCDIGKVELIVVPEK